MKTTSSTRLSNNRLSKKFENDNIDDLESILPLRMPEAMQVKGREMRVEHTMITENPPVLSAARQKAKEIGPDMSILENPLIPKNKTFSGVSESRLKAKAIGMLRNLKKYITNK